MNPDPQDLKFYQKMGVPPPTLSPLKRWQRRTAFRNDKNFFRSTCALCQKSLVTIYSGTKTFPILCYDCFWSDQFDPLKYGRDFDFNRPFFDQYAELQSQVPRLSLFHSKSINSEYTVHSAENKDCYIGGSIMYSENICYGVFVHHCKDCVDCLNCDRCEHCSECIDCKRCYQSHFLQVCEDVSESQYAYDCRGSKNLLGCVGLRHREYMVLNQSVTKEKFSEILSEIANNSGSRRILEKQYEELKKQHPSPPAWSTNIENCSGNYLNNCKNTNDAIGCQDAEDCRYIQQTFHAKDVCDTTNNMPSERVYEAMGIVSLYSSMFCFLCYYSDHILYGDNIQNSSNCFGSISLKKKQYCILNKEYAKDDYLALVAKIIEHMKETKEWGEFFPISCSPIPYNESVAQEYFPLNREEALQLSYSWNDQTPLRIPEKTAAIELPLPELASASKEETLQKTCLSCQKAFRIIAQELRFYRAHHLPLPQLCFNCRHLKRLISRPDMSLVDRVCGKCGTHIRTTVEEPRMVFCEECYLKTLY